MDYYGLLFLYYLKGLSGKSVLRLFFNIEAGGTEQLLPENTSTPTTSPLLADIQYPDGLRTDQYFTYRETPTTVSNKARIKTIKGNTLKWNQLVQNGNFADTSNWSAYSASYSSISANNNVLTQTLSGTVTGSTYQYGVSQNNVFNDASHKYLICLTVAPSFTTDFRVELGGSAKIMSETVNANATKTITGIVTPATYNKNFLVYPQSGAFQTDVSGQTIKYRNVMLFDLTAMGLASLTNDEIFQWFADNYPLPYYQYDSGSLLSFRGEGLKTVGKNQFDKNTAQSGKTINASGQVINGGHYVSAYIPILPNTNYYLSNILPARNGRTGFTYDGSLNPISGFVVSGLSSSTSGFFTAPSNARYMVLSTDTPDICQLEFGTTPSSYEPYTSSTTNLPISTYFPTGMKDAPDGDGGKIYDELTNSKAITRVGSRAYQSGDEDDTSVITDGTTTYYALATPTETPITTEDANEALSLLMGKSVSSDNANQLINIITKGE